MKKYLTTAAIAVTLASSMPAHADWTKIQWVGAFAAGCQMNTVSGLYCAIAESDAGAASICSLAYAAKMNSTDTELFAAGTVGWGAQTYGQNSCASMYAQ